MPTLMTSMSASMFTMGVSSISVRPIRRASYRPYRPAFRLIKSRKVLLV